MSSDRIWATLDPFVEGGDLLGRKVANASFLEALLAADPFTGYHFFLETEEALERQRGWLETRFPSLAGRGAFGLFLQRELHAALTRRPYFVFHLSDCLGRMTALARLRSAFSSRLFPITAPTHSLSYQRFMPGYLAHLWQGVSPRDAIIATSLSAVAVLESVFAGLRRSYGLDEASFPAPGLVHVPLGVDTASLPQPGERWDAGTGGPQGNKAAAFRRSLGIGRETLFLCLARISRSSKMDPLPLLAAFKNARSLGLDGQNAVLVLAGWADEGDPLPEALQSYAQALGVRLILRIRPDMEERRLLYAAADVFLSPADNIQETFGLTVAEAGAAGLPVIASDFDGYRDIVIQEETGLLIPILGFAHSEETNVLSGLWYDNQYHLRLAQEAAVDIQDLAGALARLGNDAALRARMGAAARKRCLDLFSWEAVIPRYVALWEELAARPVPVERERAMRQAGHPMAMDFAACFKAHFSLVLDKETAEDLLLRRSPMGEALYRGAVPPLEYAGQEHMLDREALRRVLLAARKPVPAVTLLHAAEQGMDLSLREMIRREQAAFAVLWALKQGYLERVSG